MKRWAVSADDMPIHLPGSERDTFEEAKVALAEARIRAEQHCHPDDDPLLKIAMVESLKIVEVDA